MERAYIKVCAWIKTEKVRYMWVCVFLTGIITKWYMCTMWLSYSACVSPRVDIEYTYSTIDHKVFAKIFIKN